MNATQGQNESPLSSPPEESAKPGAAPEESVILTMLGLFVVWFALALTFKADTVSHRAVSSPSRPESPAGTPELRAPITPQDR